MTTRQLALIVGGLLPALLLGLAALFQKLAAQGNMGTGLFLMISGLAISAVGGLFLLGEQNTAWNNGAVGWTLAFAVCWALATGLISLALRRLDGSISQLAPLYNMNTLVAVLAGLVVLAEWKTVQPGAITLASLLIIAGGILAARS
jgi:uncharacterized membrane protein